MKLVQTFQFQIKPNGKQRKLMLQFAGNARKIWNLILAKQQNYIKEEKFTSSFGMNYWLIELKKEMPYLAKSPAQTLQQVTKNLELAFKSFFAKRAGFPKFKKKGRGSNGFRYPQGFKLEQNNSRIYLPKLGWISYYKSRNILGKIKNVTVKQYCNKWFISIQTQHDMPQPKTMATTEIGIDVGIARFATLSNGDYIEPLNSFKRKSLRLARYQRCMSRKKKFSKNWKRAKTRVQKIHYKIANARKDFLHKTTTTISKNHAIVCIEDLQIKNMSKSAKGNFANPGCNIQQKSGLNRSILDQAWGEFRRQLEYKLAWRGGLLVAVNPKNTSRRCPSCHHTCANNRTTQEKFICVECGYANNADVVGAINILEQGHCLLACGELGQLDHSVKQEPAEMTQALVA